MTRLGAPKRVLVLGAGMSGLVAAYTLRQAGHHVQVLEAKQHPGGRVQTLRDGFTPGLHADGGAAFIPGSHTLTVGFATHFGLRLDPIPTAPGASVDFLHGVRVVDTMAAAAQWPVTLGAAEAGRPPIAWLIDYIKAAIPQILATDPRAPGWPPPALQAFDDVTFHHFLTDQGASEGAIEVLRLGFPDLWGDGIDATSALLILRDTAYAFASAPSAGGGTIGHRTSGVAPFSGIRRQCHAPGRRWGHGGGAHCFEPTLPHQRRKRRPSLRLCRTHRPPYPLWETGDAPNAYPYRRACGVQRWRGDVRE